LPKIAEHLQYIQFKLNNHHLQVLRYGNKTAPSVDQLVAIDNSVHFIL